MYIVGLIPSIKTYMELVFIMEYGLRFGNFGENADLNSCILGRERTLIVRSVLLLHYCIYFLEVWNLCLNFCRKWCKYTNRR